jgi:hypothetical protein
MLETLNCLSTTQGGDNVEAESISRKEAIAWLAGIIDGEGCIYANWQKPMKGMAGPGMRVFVNVSGTHPSLIAKVSRVYKLCELRFSIAVLTVRGNHTRPSANITVAGKGNVSKLLKILLPHLTEKKHQAELMLELIDYREQLAGTFDNRTGTLGSKPLYLWEDPIIVSFIDKLKKAKRDFPSMLLFSRQSGQEFGSQSSETLRSLLRLDEVKIKSELHGDMQSPAETIGPQSL